MIDQTETPDAPEPATEEAEPQRLTINVVGDASCARFLKLAQRSKCPTTDELVNRALTLYEFMFSEFVSGSQFYILREGDEGAQKMKIFNVYKYCPQCKNELSIDASNCDNCGLIIQ